MPPGVAQSSLNEEEKTIWNQTFISVFLTNALLYLAQMMVQPLITSYAQSLGATQIIIGTVAGAFTVTSILLKVVSAPAIDTFNRKFVLFGAMCVMGISFLGFGMAESINAIMGFRLLQGCGQAFTAACCLALATDALPQEKLGQGIGIFSLAQAMCQALGPGIGKFVQGRFGYSATFFLAGALMLFGALLALRMKTRFVRTQKFKLSFSSMFAREAVIPAIILFFLAMVYSLINSFLYIFAAEQLTPGENNYIGFFFTVYATTLLFTRPAVGRLTDKCGTVKVLLPAMCCYALSFLLISWSNSIWMFLASAFISAFGYGACQPMLQALCMKLVPKDKRGAGSCTNYIGTDLGNLIGPVLGGTIATSFGYTSMWQIMLIPLAIAMLIVLACHKCIDPSQN